MRKVAILDDFFPHQVSAFRFEEFCSYLDEFANIEVYSNGNALSFVDLQPSATRNLIHEYLRDHPRHSKRIHHWNTNTLPEADAYYCIFLNNIWASIEAIDQSERPFAFTLYPGGGLNIDEPVSDSKLRRVCSSRNLKYVIVTQPNVRRYLVEKNFLPGSMIAYIPGVVVPRESLISAPRSYFGRDKSTLDVGFIAAKYSTHGKDKGYDLFVEAAQALYESGVSATYHVVGPWAPETISLGPVATQFQFHGFLLTEQLKGLCRKLDVVVSPNRHSILAKGAFDGFPTGCCVAAGLQGAAMVCTDPLSLSDDYIDGEQMILIRPNLEETMSALLQLYRRPELIAKLGKSGQEQLERNFGHQSQIVPRISLMRRLMREPDCHSAIA